MKIKKKMLLAFLTSSLLLLAFLFIFMERQIKESVFPLNVSITQQMVDERCEQINSWVQKRLIELGDITSFAKRYPLKKAQLEEELQLLKQRNMDNYHTFRFITKEGISKGADGSVFNVANRDYFLDLKKHPAKRYSISNLLKSQEDKKSIVIICYRLEDAALPQFSYLAAAVSLDKVLSLAQELPIYDGKGVLLDSGKKEEPLKKGMVRLTGDIALLPGWKINYQISKYRLEANANHFNRNILLTVFLTLVLMGALMSFLLKIFADPLLNLKKTMVKVQAGDRKVRAKVIRPDEIGEVAHLFNETLERVYRNEENYRKASILLMQEQIKPHFLYNTLDTIQWLIMESEPEKAVEILDQLTLFLRKGLNNGKETTTLKNELAHVNSYWQIQKNRYEKLQAIDFSVAKEDLAAPVLHFILQPVVENALYHGIRPSKKENLYLKIQVDKKASFWEIKIINNGLPLTPEKLQALNSQSSTGFGIKNVQDRLKHYYHQPATLSYQVVGEETIATFCLPILERKTHELENFNH